MSKSKEDPIELYAVVSEYVVDQEGTWEKPDNWPDENTYSEKPAQDPLPDPEASATLERIHEVAWLFEDGRYEVERFHISWFQPFTGAAWTNTYKPD